MRSLVTRFHFLLLSVTVALTAVGYLRIPADFAFPAHWAGSGADWLWPRNFAIAVAPIVQVVLLVKFFVLGRLLTKNHYAKTQHILDPALTLLMFVVAATQLGLLVTGIGSDLDFVRLTGFGLGAGLIIFGIVLSEAERHTYAGFRAPWPVQGDLAWKLVHRIAGLGFGLGGAGLLLLAWFDLGTGPLVLGFVASLYGPILLAGLTTLLTRRAT